MLYRILALSPLAAVLLAIAAVSGDEDSWRTLLAASLSLLLGTAASFGSLSYAPARDERAWTMARYCLCLACNVVLLTGAVAVDSLFLLVITSCLTLGVFGSGLYRMGRAVEKSHEARSKGNA